MDIEQRNEIVSICNCAGVPHVLERIFLVLGVEAYQDENSNWCFVDLHLPKKNRDD